MAAVEVTISGILYDKLNRTQQQVVLVGEGSLTGLGIGGGPIIPPGRPPGGPDHIWGPTDPRPGNPISGIPGLPGYEPPGRPPDPVTPPVEWKTIWTPTDGWVVVGVIKPQGDHVTPSAPSAAAAPKK